jgi:hypothetical protein
MGGKWILIQAKYGPRVGHEWKRLVEVQCPEITRPARVVVYHADKFICADVRKVETGRAPRPPTGLTHRSRASAPWYNFDGSMEFFFRCWGGSRSALPHPLDTQYLLILASGRSRDEASVALAEAVAGLTVEEGAPGSGEAREG